MGSWFLRENYKAFNEERGSDRRMVGCDITVATGGLDLEG